MTNSRKSTIRSSALERKRIQGLLDNPPSHKAIRSEVQLAVDNGSIQVIRELAVRDQARFLEIIDQVRTYHHSPHERWQPLKAPLLTPLNPETHEQAASTVPVEDTKFVSILGDISSDILLLPNSTGSLQRLKKHEGIAASGRTTDIWRGTWNDRQVAFKAFRIYPNQDLQEAKRILWKLVPIWKRLNHENILPFHGVDTSMFQLALVYDWGHNGNITQYLESNPDASRPELVSTHPHLVLRNAFPDPRLKLLQVAKGLKYLHSLGIAHGDLKAVSKHGSPQHPCRIDGLRLG